MTLTPLFTLTHHCQVKDDFIILQKFSIWTQLLFRLQTTDRIKKKHIQKAYFCMLSVAPMETENVQRCHIVEPGGGGAKGSKQASHLVSIATRWEYF